MNAGLKSRRLYLNFCTFFSKGKLRIRTFEYSLCELYDFFVVTGTAFSLFFFISSVDCSPNYVVFPSMPFFLSKKLGFPQKKKKKICRATFAAAGSRDTVNQIES